MTTSDSMNLCAPADCDDRPSMTGLMSVSVIICTRNRAEDLARALATLSRVTPPPASGVEIIVVDNASTDHTPQVVERARETMPFPLLLLREEARGLGAARNCGLRHASGSIIAFTDDDCIVSEDWLSRIVAHFAGEAPPGLLGGRVELFNDAHLPMTVLTSMTPIRLAAEEHPGGLLLGCNMAFHRRLLDRIGAFDPRFGAGTPLIGAEDQDFIQRAQRAGFAVHYEPDVVLHHNHGRTTPAQAESLLRGYAFSDGACLMKHLLAGDRLALRLFYWRLASLIRQARRPPAGPTGMPGFRLVWAYLRGAGRFLLRSRSLPGAPWIAPRTSTEAPEPIGARDPA